MLTILCSWFWNPYAIAIFAVVWAIYHWGTATFATFERKGVDFVKPYPLFGNFVGVLFRTQTFHEHLLESYNAFKHKRLSGVFQFRTPLLLIRDPELIKRITVKDFDHFANHRDVFFNEEVEPLMGKSLFMLRDQKWRDMRSTLSPAFTGSKMRLMFRLIDECAHGAGEILLQEASRHADAGKPFVPELKDIFARCMTDVIASAAFGLQVNSLADRSNPFYQHGRQSVNFSMSILLRGMFMNKFPRLAAALGMTFFDPKHREFYRRLVIDTMHHREVNGIVRPDMIQLLMDAKRGALTKAAEEATAVTSDEQPDAMGFATVRDATATGGQTKRVWTDDDFTSQCFLFFLAGFETSSTLMCVAVHELMENQDVQRRLRAEVDAVREELKGAPLTYERLQKMQYLDMVVSETLRKWPPVTATDRECTKRYVIEDEICNDRPLVVEKGDGLMIPILGLHRDPLFYPDPERFDPERFSEQNRHTIQPLAYLPFGAGPRSCIASRFALMQVKGFLFQMMTVFTFEVADTTRLPLRQVQTMFAIEAEGGYNVHLRPRTEPSTTE